MDGVGCDCYFVILCVFFGDDVDFDEMYVFGWDELVWFIDEMWVVVCVFGVDLIEVAVVWLDDDFVVVLLNLL